MKIFKEHMKSYPYTDIFNKPQIEKLIEEGLKQGYANAQEEILELIDKWYFKTRKKKTYVDLSDVTKLKKSITQSQTKK